MRPSQSFFGTSGDDMEHFYKDIYGWFSFEQIYRDALAEAKDGARFVEVGTWYGRSAAFMAVEIANSGKQIDFYCVDTWKGSSDEAWMTDHLRPLGGSCRHLFDAVMAKGGVSHIVKPIEKPSVVAAADFEDESLDFVLIDAGHDYDNVRADVRAWLPKVKPGGVIAGDDLDWPGVLIGVAETIPRGQIVMRNYYAHPPKTKKEPLNWWHRKQRREPGEWVSQRFAENMDALIYIPYVNNESLLERALRSVERHWNSVMVIDQSQNGLSERWRPLLGGVYRVPHRAISFTEMMNWARDEAIARNLDTLIFMHSDAACSDARVIDDVLDMGWAHRAGITFTAYDALAAFRVDMLRDVGPWDETFRWYFSDVDYYRRVGLAGWTRQHACGSRVLHTPSQTLNTDQAIRAEVLASTSWHIAHYQHKWGGGNGTERYTQPYDGRAF